MNNLRDEKLLKKFGEHLQKLRKEKGLSIRELALEADIDHAQIHKIEHGKINPTLSTLIVIAEALKISISEVVNF